MPIDFTPAWIDADLVMYRDTVERFVLPDARVQRIYGGASEIMKEAISPAL